MGIFVALKNDMMDFKLIITKKLVLRLALFIAVIGAANLFDIYFGNNPDKLDCIQHKPEKHSTEHGTIYLFSQTNPVSAKTLVQKPSNRRIDEQYHDKFLQKFHQKKNYQVLKVDEKKPTTPLFLSYHYLVFRNYYFTVPDEEPPLC